MSATGKLKWETEPGCESKFKGRREADGSQAGGRVGVQKETQRAGVCTGQGAGWLCERACERPPPSAQHGEQQALEEWGGNWLGLPTLGPWRLGWGLTREGATAANSKATQACGHPMGAVSSLGPVPPALGWGPEDPPSPCPAASI